MVLDKFLREKLRLITFLVLKKMMLQFYGTLMRRIRYREDTDENGFYFLNT